MASHPRPQSTTALPRANHQRTIDELAQRTHCPVEEVADLYWGELQDLRRTADVPDFVPVFAARRTRDQLLRRRPRNG
jgi:hypothetical protein